MVNRSKPLITMVARSGCHEIISHKPKENGYIYLRIEGTRKFAHRYVYEQNYGPIPPGLLIRHTCDNPKCINPTHLLTGTIADNIQDCVERKRNAMGEKNGGAKLTEAQVKMILQETGSTHKAIATKYGVHRSMVSRIKSGVYWKHITKSESVESLMRKHG